MNLDFLNSIVLITSDNPENRRFGTGFVIHHSLERKISYVLTCAHVIRECDNENKGRAKIDGKPRGFVYVSSQAPDLAIVYAEELLDRPIIKLGTYGSIGAPFIAAGFSVYGNHYSIKNFEGILTEKVQLLANTENRIPAWGIKLNNDQMLQDGYSGSPIIDKNSGCCVGVISYKQGEGHAGLGIAIEELENLSLVGDSQVIPIEKVYTNENYLQILFSKATRLQIEGNLGEAIEIFRQIKAANPTYPRIDVTINSIETELKRGYVDQNGIVMKTIGKFNYYYMDLKYG